MGSPKYFYELSGKMMPWFLWLGLALLITGYVWGLLFSPPDYQQGETVRIFYIHVPSAYMSMACYSLIALCAVIGLVWKMKLAFMVAKSAAPLGAAFTFLALFTGAVWGKPMWGTWWFWDARIVSMLILFFIYIGLIGLNKAFDDDQSADEACSILACVGFSIIPIIHFSVEWWNTLHQPATISMTSGPKMELEMLWPFFIVFVGINLFFGALVMMRTRTEVLRRERRSQWVRNLITKEVG